MTGTPSERPAAGEPLRRLHPSSLLFSLGLEVRRWIIPGILVLLASRGDRADVWVMMLFIPVALASLARYLSYRYRLGREELVVREGIVTRNERHIPYDRIQNVDLKQNLVHRMFRVAEVRIETASGEKPEAVIRVLSLRAVDALRRRIFAERDAAAEPAPSSHTLLRLSAADLLVLGLLSNRALALIAAALGVLWQFSPEDLEQRMERLARRAADLGPSLEATDPATTVVLAVAGALAALLLMKLLSVGWVVVRYQGFTLRRSGDDLRAEYGLLTRVSITIPRQRIQLLSTVRGPLRRLLGRAAVQVETAGSRQENEGGASDRLWLAPIIREEQLSTLLAEVLPGVELDEPGWRGIAPRARGRMFRKGALVTMLLTAPLVVVAGIWGLLLLPAGIGLAWARAVLFVRHAAYATPAGAVLFRSGWWARKLSVVRCGKIQVLTMAATPFDRRARMARLHVDTAGAGRIGHPVAIPYLDAAIAAETFARLNAAASRTAFRW